MNCLVPDLNSRPEKRMQSNIEFVLHYTLEV